jgi:signal transduction histidine kinase
MSDQAAFLYPQTTSRKNIDLKWSLTLRVVAVALSCFLAAAALALFTTAREVQRTNDKVAETVGRLLELQLFRIENGVDALANFPDWAAVIDQVQAPGQCVQYVTNDGNIARTRCTGISDRGPIPQWFSRLCTIFMPSDPVSVRPISYRGHRQGALRVSTDAAVVTAALWRDVAGMLGLSALTILAICALIYVAIARALAPTRHVLAGLDRLSRGDLTCRLPAFHLAELHRISAVFNLLASRLESTTRERTALAGRLVDAEEQERRRLASELHDELAQDLSAISAMAASIEAGIKTSSPALAAEANRLSRTSRATMMALRSALRHLRPPEIDDLGLASSLSGLVAEHEQRAVGGLQIALETHGELEALPAIAAGHVYRIVQESLNNIAKHAQARHAWITLRFRRQFEPETDHHAWLELSVEDDGHGETAARPELDGGGLGIIGMRERILALGGFLEAGPVAGKGFRVHARIPFAGPSR